jgi:WD40 repeat protein
MTSIGSFALGPRWERPLPEFVTGVGCTASGALVAAATAAGDVAVFDAEDGRERWVRAIHRAGVLDLDVHPREALVATAGEDGKACITSLETGEALATLDHGRGWVERARWSADGRLLATVSGKQLRVWTSRGEPYEAFPPHRSSIAAVAWRKGGDDLALVGYGGATIVRLPKRSGGRIETRALDWKGSLVSAAWSPDAKVLACGTQEGMVHFWRLPSGRDSEMRGYPSKPKHLDFDVKSTLFATDCGEEVLVWDFRRGPEGTAPIDLRGHRGQVTALRFAPRGELLATGAEDHALLVWDPKRGGQPRYGFTMNAEISALAWMPSATALLVGDGAGHLARVDLG